MRRFTISAEKIENCIITPTYEGHFPFVKKYLETYVHFVKDAKFVPVFFIISKTEEAEFKEIIFPYEKKANLQILFFENILAEYGITNSSEDLLKSYGRYSFQTLKKMYAIKYINAKHFLILDSESYFIKPTNLTAIFSEFFQSPFVVYSSFHDRIPSAFMTKMQLSTEYVLKTKIDFWTIESNMWFIDKKIFTDLTQTCGEPVEWCSICKKHYPENANLEEEGLMEALLYQNWLCLNAEKYAYTKIDICKELCAYLSAEEFSIYLQNINSVFKSGVGVLEGILVGTYDSILEKVVEVLNNLNLSILRCDFSDFWNYKRQKYIVKHTKVHILACSQNNIFYFKPFSNFSFYKRALPFGLGYLTLFKEYSILSLKPIIVLGSRFFFSMRWNNLSAF